MNQRSLALVGLVLLAGVTWGVPGPVSADDLTLTVQEHLEALGYDPGATDGEMTSQTANAIVRFETDRGLPIMGEATPDLVRELKAAAKEQGKATLGQEPRVSSSAEGTSATPAASTPAAVASSPGESMENLRARQQECLRQKAESKENRAKKKRGFGRLLRAAGRLGNRFGLGGELNQLAWEIYDVDATADDIAGAAKDLGLTEEEVEKCRNPERKGDDG